MVFHRTVPAHRVEPRGVEIDEHPLRGVERAAATIDTVKDNFRDNWPTSAAVYLPGNKVPAPGSL